MKGIKNENDEKKSLHGIRRNGIRRNGKIPPAHVASVRDGNPVHQVKSPDHLLRPGSASEKRQPGRPRSKQASTPLDDFLLIFP